MIKNQYKLLSTPDEGIFEDKINKAAKEGYILIEYKPIRSDIGILYTAILEYLPFDSK